MTTDEAIEKLRNLQSGDQEMAHAHADDILLEVLRDLGHTDVADAWQAAHDRIGFWYA